jgi:glycosyltransferase involved in cell wall biosynthesis
VTESPAGSPLEPGTPSPASVVTVTTVAAVDADRDAIEVTGHVERPANDPEVATEIVAVNRATHDEVATPATADGGRFTGRLSATELRRVATDDAEVLDVHLRVHRPDGTSTLQRIAADASAQLSWARLGRRGRPGLHVQPYVTRFGNLSLRVIARPDVAGTPDGERRAAPRVVRWLALRTFDRIESRTRRARASAPPAAPTDRPTVTYLMRSAYGTGGTVRTVVHVANYLVGAGYDVRMVSLLRPRERPGFTIHRRVRMRPLYDERLRVQLRARPVPAPSWPHRLARDLTIRSLDRWQSVLVHPREVMFPRSSLLTDVLLVRALQRLRPGVLLATRPSLNVAAARFAAPGVRTIGQEHHNFPSYHPALRDWMLEHYGKLDALTVLTRDDERDFRAALVGSDTLIRRIPNGLPALPTEVSDLGAPVIVAAGRLSRTKGYDLLVDAFARVAQTHPEWEVRIFGIGALEQQLRRQIAAHHLGERVHLMGHTRAMAKELARASVFALSSRYEGLPMVVIEAMGAGLPVVAFDCPRGPADLIHDGVDGFLVPPQDVDAFAASLNTLMSDESLRSSMAQAARSSASNMTLDRIGKLWEDLLREL